MKKVFVFFLLIFISCDSEDAPDCFQTSGDLIKKEIEVEDFERILVMPNIQLLLKQGEDRMVEAETGSNLINEISTVIEGNRLVVRNTNNCDLFRNSNTAKITVTTPVLTEVRSASQLEVLSEGILRFPSLKLISEDFNEDNNGNTNGIFRLTVENNDVRVVGNNITSFFLKGKTDNLQIELASGTGRFDGSELAAKRVTIKHRGTNKMIVNPIESLKGEIRSTGDLISVTKPPIVDVKELFTGKLIFK